MVNKNLTTLLMGLALSTSVQAEDIKDINLTPEESKTYQLAIDKMMDDNYSGVHIDEKSNAKNCYVFYGQRVIPETRYTSTIEIAINTKKGEDCLKLECLQPELSKDIIDETRNITAPYSIKVVHENDKVKGAYLEELIMKDIGKDPITHETVRKIVFSNYVGKVNNHTVKVTTDFGAINPFKWSCQVTDLNSNAWMKYNSEIDKQASENSQTLETALQPQVISKQYDGPQIKYGLGIEPEKFNPNTMIIGMCQTHTRYPNKTLILGSYNP